MKISLARSFSRFWLSCLLLAAYAAPVSAQFKLQQDFKGTTATGWTLSNSAILTAPSIDAAGAGWLRLTDTGGNEKGLALDNAFSFAGNVPVTVEFNYVSWGGTGADGITLFLYDSTTASPMAGAQTGGGLGYCGGAGGYLAVALDEYGNFSNPADKCTAASGGPGSKPESLVIRGPASASNPWITTTSVPGGIDIPHVATRPSSNTVLMTLTPAAPPATGYTITTQFRNSSGQPFQTLFSNVAFPYAPPTNISVGFSAGTGGSTNVHEVQGLAAATPADLQVTMTGPSSVLQGGAVSYNVTVTNNGNNTLSGADSPSIVDNMPVSISGVSWTCTGTVGASCDASGTGNINTSNAVLPPNGSVSYTITGTLDPVATCGTSVANSANADFSSITRFLDPDETNNSATLSSTVICNTTLVANPTSLAFAPQQVGSNSTTQTVTVTEGMNSSTITSIAVTGDYSQTNNCPSTLASGQTCTITVTFTPTAEGSRGGTVTVLSNAAASPTVTSTTTLSGTGTNSIPSTFSFTALVNVYPSSVQISNAITVSDTDVPSPISVSAGGQYSINGGPFTSVAGVVSPGAQVTLQLTAASGYSTSNSATLTIGGVSSSITVTTGAQPVLQGSFTPVSGAAPSSTQTSNAITVSGTTLSAPITITGGSYSINGGPFTTAAGTVLPGDQVVVQMTAASTYNTTSSAIAAIGGVNSTFTVTTGAAPPPQGDFTPVTGSSVGVTQLSSPITITSITFPAPISISGGGQYSINGGPFTSTAGTVQPGDQVVVEITAPSTYNSTATAVLNVGGTVSNFAVTTGTQPVIQGSFTAVGSAPVSSTQTSAPITVTGITSPTVISIAGGQYSINGGPYTSAPGTVQPGDQVTVQVTSPSTYSTTAIATLNIDGVTAIFSVTTAAQPINVGVTGGGGAMGPLMLLTLMLLIVCKVFGARRGALALPAAIVVGMLVAYPAHAEEEDWLSNFYGGIRWGVSTSSMTATKLTRELQVDGYDVTAAGSQRGTTTGTLFVGYELPHHLAVELAGAYVGRTRAALQGVQQSDLDPLLQDAARIVRGAGDIIALEARYRCPLAPIVDLDLRAGPYVWITKTDVYVNGSDQLHRTDTGLGYTVGVGPRFALGDHVGVGLGADFLQSNSNNHFVLISATLEYHFR